MSEWRENDNGNYVYLLDTDEVMTVFHRNGKWFGAYADRFTEDGFCNPEKTKALMERAVLEGEHDLLVKRRPVATGWRETKSGGYQCVRHGCILTVKQARSGGWYLVVDQVPLKDHWFDSAEEAKRQGDQL